MSYLVQYAARRPTAAGRRQRRARVDERLVLNRPQFDGGAHVRIFVEDTSGRRRRIRRTPPVPRIRLRIADCANQIARLGPLAPAGGGRVVRGPVRSTLSPTRRSSTAGGRA